jgi:glycosyltransferase involved in cell wall biosynthesis
MKLSIALCTYNGGKYLRQQLDSILKQTCLPDEVVVCDDCSTDATSAILEYFEKIAPFTVRIHCNQTNLGPTGNFAKAISLCQGDWIFLCDQDDHWLPNKIELSTRKLFQLEESYGKDTPLLVHTDAVVTDENLQAIHPSLWKFQHSYPENGHALAKLLNQNLVTGCTVAMNRTLRDKALPISNKVMMHDWWLALVASAFGRVESISAATMLYRQHGMNDTGAKPWGLAKALATLLDIRNRNYILKTNKDISNRIRQQAAEFLRRYNDELSPQQQKTISAFIDLPQRSYFVRKFLTIKYGLHYQGLLRNIGNLLLK